MKENFTVRERGGRVNAVVMRFDGGCLNEKWREQGVYRRRRQDLVY